jgi:hypothetical protein
LETSLKKIPYEEAKTLLDKELQLRAEQAKLKRKFSDYDAFTLADNLYFE